jgi:hypothetical protein
MTSIWAGFGRALVVTVALSLVGLWSGARAPTTSAAARPAHGAHVTAASLPRQDSVVRGRYATTVRLDGGTLTVAPPPSATRPRLAEATARSAFTADAQLAGYHRVVFGYGVATIRLRAHGVGRVTRLPAWVGFAKSAASFNCPATSSNPTDVPVPASNGYAAVVIGSVHGAPAVTYVARSAPCNAVVPASVANASRSISIPWRTAGPVDNGSVRIEATVPPCGTVGGISSGGTAASVTITVYAVVPDIPRHCRGPSSASETIALPPGGGPGAPPPLLTGRTAIRHGRLGPADVVQAA